MGCDLNKFLTVHNLLISSITTEDKYGTTPINSSTNHADEDEEFLKSNETMKDLTPPKLTPANLTIVPSNSSAVKQLYASSPPILKAEIKPEMKAEVKPVPKDITPLNGLTLPTTTPTADSKASECKIINFFDFHDV